MNAKSQPNSHVQWPVSAASKIRVIITKEDDAGEPQYCRLFYNESNYKIDLVPTDDEVHKRQVYDDVDTGIEHESTYKSYIKSMNDADKRVLDFFHLDDVIGTDLSLEYNVQNPKKDAHRNSSSAFINVYAYSWGERYQNMTTNKNKNCYEAKRSACHKKFLIDSQCCEDIGDVRKLVDAIRSLALLQSNTPVNNNPVRYLVIMNPYSGGGGVTSKTGAKYIYETIFYPMLEQAGIEHDVLVSGREGHARERMKVRNDQVNNGAAEHFTEAIKLDEKVCSISLDEETKDISEYNAVIAMGGDGIMFEIMQGIHDREDEKDILNNLKFGIVGCGTSNGLAKSILHWSGVSSNVMLPIS